MNKNKKPLRFSPDVSKIDRRFVAYHEAGHAVVAMLQAIPVYLISIIPTPRAEGITEVHDVGGLFAKLKENFELGTHFTSTEAFELQQHARMLMAGGIAQYRFDPKTVRTVPLDPDFLPLSLLNEIVGSQRELNALLALLNIQTEEMVERGWDMIDVIARTLMDRLELTGAEALEVLRETPDPRTTGSVFKSNLKVQLLASRKFCLPDT